GATMQRLPPSSDHAPPQRTSARRADPFLRYRTLADGIGGMERRGAAPGGQVAEAAAPGGQVAEAAAPGGRRGGPARRPSRHAGSGGAAAGGEVEEVVEHGLAARAQAVVLVLAGHPGAQARQQRSGG